MKYNVKCNQCSKDFQVYPKRYFSRDRFFCSKFCEGIYRKSTCTTKINTNCVICDLEMSLKKSEFERRNKNGEITCSAKCIGVLRSKKYLGRSNPNTKYDLDDNFFKNVDTEQKAYILGFIASDGSIAKTGEISIEIKNIDREILEKMRDVVCKDVPVRDDKPEVGDHSVVRFCSKTMTKDVCKWLKIKTGKKDSKVQMPNLKNKLKWHFLRGFFDGDGTIRKKVKGRSIDCGISTHSDDLRNSIEKLCTMGCCNSNKWKQISWSGDNAIEFLDKLYSNANIYMERKYNTYLSWKRIRV